MDTTIFLYTVLPQEPIDSHFRAFFKEKREGNEKYRPMLMGFRAKGHHLHPGQIPYPGALVFCKCAEALQYMLEKNEPLNVYAVMAGWNEDCAIWNKYDPPNSRRLKRDRPLYRLEEIIF